MTRAAERSPRFRLAASLAAALAAPLATASRADEPRGFAELDAMLASLDETGLRVDLAIAAMAPPAKSDSEFRRERFESLARPIEAWLAEPAPPAERLARLERATRLAALAERDEAASLAWPLATGRYLAAASAADLWRSGAAVPVGGDALAKRFEACAEAFDGLERAANLDRGRLAGRLLRTSGVETDLVAEEQRRLEVDALRGRFLAGWSQVQRALLALDAAEAREAARQAEARLLPLLDTGSAQPRPHEVSADRRGDPGFAQTILGVAVARGILEGPAEGRAWLDLLEHPNVERGLASARPSWELLMLAAGDEADAVRALVERWTTEGIGAGDRLRLAVAAAWPRASRSARWIPAVDAALAASACRSDLEGTGAMLMRLAERAAAPPGLGRGWLDAARAREAAAAEGGERRSLAAAERLLEVAAILEQSGSGSASGREQAAAARFERLAAESLLEGGAALEALEVLERRPRESAESAWLELVALDRLRGGGPSESREAWQERWIDAGRRFLEAHPDHPRASLVALRLGGDRLEVEALEAFAATRDPQLAREARLAIADRLAAAGREERASLAQALRGLGPSEIERRGPDAAASAAARREAFDLLEATLIVEDPDPPRAKRLLEGLDPELLAARGIETAPRERDAWQLHAAELAWVGGDAAEAARRRDAALAAARARGDDRWASIAARRWLARVAATWSPDSADAASSELLWRSAQEVLASADAGDPIVPAAAAEASRAAEARWRLSPDRSLAGDWQAAARRAAEAAPSAATSIALAESSLAVGDAASALEASRAALAHASRGDAWWRRAKRRQIEALAILDAAQARAVLDQLRVLDPAWREGEHGAALAALDRTLPPTPAGSAP